LPGGAGFAGAAAVGGGQPVVAVGHLSVWPESSPAHSGQAIESSSSRSESEISSYKFSLSLFRLFLSGSRAGVWAA
jgi:hypothetical protein